MYVLVETLDGIVQKQIELGNAYTFVSKKSDPDRFADLTVNISNSKNSIGVVQGELLGSEKILLGKSSTYVLKALDKDGEVIDSIELK